MLQKQAEKDVYKRQALHAMTLGFVHPVTGEEMYFTSELPDDMTRLIEKWRGYICLLYTSRCV